MDTFLSRPCLICFVATGDEANQAKKIQKNFDHYLDEYLGDSRQEMDPDVNIKTIDEVANAFKQVEDSIVLGTDSDSGLK
jgi:hypothetical protein